MLEEIKHTELSTKVYELMKDMILRREFKGGEKLDLNQLAHKMKVSRTPLKDAINRLVIDGLIEVKPRSGTFVSAITTTDIKHMMDVRQMIELWAISKLSADMCSSLAAKLKSNVLGSKKIIEGSPFSFSDFVNYDYEFHKAIVDLTDNPKLIQMYDTVNIPLQISRIFYFNSQERSQVGQHYHEKITELIEACHLDETTKVLVEHIEESKATMIRILNENGGSI